MEVLLVDDGECQEGRQRGRQGHQPDQGRQQGDRLLLLLLKYVRPSVDVRQVLSIFAKTFDWMKKYFYLRLTCNKERDK